MKTCSYFSKQTFLHIIYFLKCKDDITIKHLYSGAICSVLLTELLEAWIIISYSNQLSGAGRQHSYN